MGLELIYISRGFSIFECLLEGPWFCHSTTPSSTNKELGIDVTFRLLLSDLSYWPELGITLDRCSTLEITNCYTWNGWLILDIKHKLISSLVYECSCTFWQNNTTHHHMVVRPFWRHPWHDGRCDKAMKHHLFYRPHPFSQKLKWGP